MKYFFGGGSEKLSERKIGEDVGEFIDFMLLIQHAGEDILLTSNLYLIETNLQLLISYFCHVEPINVADINVLKIINERYQHIIKRNGYKKAQKEEELANLRREISEILQKNSVTIIDMWDFGCNPLHYHSLRDFPHNKGNAYLAYIGK
ncbi:MAG: hypothetical protein PHT16_02815 [Candidatus Pacebacteria bacterium]|nr:hypothetical protein [Candidatus Paceibacterota bacterium]